MTARRLEVQKLLVQLWRQVSPRAIARRVISSPCLKTDLRGKGLYIFDEPEAALSPSRQLSMLVRMHDLIADDSQFIIATHSPILMAYPDAWIYQISASGIDRVAYEDTEHYQITRVISEPPAANVGAVVEGVTPVASHSETLFCFRHPREVIWDPTS